MQRGQDAECRLFQKMAEQGHYRGRTKPTSTRQGLYATAPSGELLASLNTQNTKQIAWMLERALKRWDELTPDARKLPAMADDDDAWRWEDAYPADGLVLLVTSRDLPRPHPRKLRRGDWRPNAWNRDYAWFNREEVRSLLPERIRVGETATAPTRLAARLARCSLLDTVRGQTPSFRDDEVQHATITSRVVAIEDGIARIRFDGSTTASARGHWTIHGLRKRDAPRSCGVSTRLLGFGRFDLTAGRFASFELVAIGRRWGGTHYNARADDLDPAGIGFTLVLAPDRPEHRIAPARIWNYGWKRPGRAR